MRRNPKNLEVRQLPLALMTGRLVLDSEKRLELVRVVADLLVEAAVASHAHEESGDESA